MSAPIRPLAEITAQGTAILIREMGIVDALRFLNQFRPGSGNYTKERQRCLGELSLAVGSRRILAGAAGSSSIDGKSGRSQPAPHRY
jgi:hypothetical protein